MCECCQVTFSDMLRIQWEDEEGEREKREISGARHKIHKKINEDSTGVGGRIILKNIGSETLFITKIRYVLNTLIFFFKYPYILGL